MKEENEGQVVILKYMADCTNCSRTIQNLMTNKRTCTFKVGLGVRCKFTPHALPHSPQPF